MINNYTIDVKGYYPRMEIDHSTGREYTDVAYEYGQVKFIGTKKEMEAELRRMRYVSPGINIIGVDWDEDYHKVHEKYFETHIIKKRKGTEVNLKELNDNESVVMGDGETYHWLLTERTKVEDAEERFNRLRNS